MRRYFQEKVRDLKILREARYRQPFQPFALRLKDGRKIPVVDWGAIGISRFHVLVIGEDESLTKVNPDDIDSIVYPAPVS